MRDIPRRASLPERPEPSAARSHKSLGLSNFRSREYLLRLAKLLNGDCLANSGPTLRVYIVEEVQTSFGDPRIRLVQRAPFVKGAPDPRLHDHCAVLAGAIFTPHIAQSNQSHLPTGPQYIAPIRRASCQSKGRYVAMCTRRQPRMHHPDPLDPAASTWASTTLTEVST